MNAYNKNISAKLLNKRGYVIQSNLEIDDNDVNDNWDFVFVINTD